MKYLYICALLVSNSALASGGYNFFTNAAQATHIPAHTLALIVGSLIFLAIAVAYRAKASGARHVVIPDQGITLRNILESLAQMIYSTAKSVMGEDAARKHFSYVVFVFLFILLTNVIGLFPGSYSPNQSLNTTLALGFFTFFYFNYQGIREVGFVDYFKHFAGPMPALALLIFPIELISISVRPISLALRLRGNMEGDHMVLGIFSDLVPYLVPIPFYAMGLFVSFLQAFVFTILTMIYVGMATAHHDHGEYEHH